MLQGALWHSQDSCELLGSLQALGNALGKLRDPNNMNVSDWPSFALRTLIIQA